MIGYYSYILSSVFEKTTVILITLNPITDLLVWLIINKKLFLILMCYILHTRIFFCFMTGDIEQSTRFNMPRRKDTFSKT